MFIPNQFCFAVCPYCGRRVQSVALGVTVA